MTNNNLNYKVYAKLAGGFYPSKFVADFSDILKDKALLLPFGR